jgi:hypothetical protein
MSDGILPYPNFPDVIQDMKKDISEVRSEGNKIKDEVSGLKVDFAGIHGDITHLASCFQELNATICEFMTYQRELNQTLLLSCNREERWSVMKDNLASVCDRMSTIERADCPKQSVLDDISVRMKKIEDVHIQEKGENQGGKPYREFILENLKNAILLVQTAVLVYFLAKIGLST